MGKRALLLPSFTTMLGKHLAKEGKYLWVSGADPDRGERGSSHGQIFSTLKNSGLTAFPDIGFQTFSGGAYYPEPP